MAGKSGEILLYIILGGGILMRAVNLGSKSFGIDEYCTAFFASRSRLFYSLIEIMARDMQPPVFYFMERFMGFVFGFNEISMRFLPFVFGTANMFIVYRFARALFSEKIALLTVFLFAFNPYQIYYSQEARSYSLFLMTSLLILYYFMMSLKYNKIITKPLIFWSVAGTYVHSHTVLILIVLNFIIFFVYKEAIRRDLWIKAQLIIGLCIVPLLPFFVKSALGDQYSHNTLMFIAPLITLKNYIFGFTVDFNALTVMGLLLAGFLIFLGLFTTREKYKKNVNILFIVSGLYMIMPWLISLMGKPIYSERTFILVSALVLVLLAVGASYFSGKGLSVFVVVMVVIYGISIYNLNCTEKFRKTPYKKEFLKIEKQFKTGDAVVHSNNASYASFEFYNKIMYKTNFENRMLGEIPEFTGGSARKGLRELWRKVKAGIAKITGVEVYAGYDKNTLTAKEANDRMREFKRVWFIKDTAVGLKQIWLPMGNVWYSKSTLGVAEPPNVAQLPWVKRYFTVKKVDDSYGFETYLLEAK